MTTHSSQEGVRGSERTPHRIRLIVFRVLATLVGLFFVVAVCLHLPAPWVILQSDEPHPELDRWFFTVSGAVDLIGAGVLLALAQRPRRTLLVAEWSLAVIIAAVIILPFQPTFAAILAVGILPLLFYPYWGDVRAFPSWWAGTDRAVLALAIASGAALLVTAAIALPRQITGTDVAAQANWWVDYTEHATVLAMAGVLAASRGPGCRILATLCSAVWLYLGLVAVLVLPYHTGSWGRAGGAFAVLIGVGFAVTTWRRAQDPAATAELPAD
jgi:hypothetical protein